MAFAEKEKWVATVRTRASDVLRDLPRKGSPQRAL
jgi:hypothetical protein